MAKIRVTQQKVTVGIESLDNVRLTRQKTDVAIKAGRSRLTRQRITVGIKSSPVRLTQQRLLLLSNPPNLFPTSNILVCDQKVEIEWWADNTLLCDQEATAQVITIIEDSASNQLICNQNVSVDVIYCRNLIDPLIFNQQLTKIYVNCEVANNTLIFEQLVSQTLLIEQFPNTEFCPTHEVNYVLDKNVSAINTLLCVQQVEKCQIFNRSIVTNNACCFQTLFLDGIYCRNVGNTLVCNDNVDLNFNICINVDEEFCPTDMVNTIFINNINEEFCPIQTLVLEKITEGGTASGENDLIALGNIIQLGLTEKF